MIFQVTNKQSEKAVDEKSVFSSFSISLYGLTTLILQLSTRGSKHKSLRWLLTKDSDTSGEPNGKMFGTQ